MHSIEPAKLQISKEEILKRLTDHFASKIEELEIFYKSSSAHENAPAEENFLARRSASVMLKLFYAGEIYFKKFLSIYGRKKNRGRKPSRHAVGSKYVLSQVLNRLQELELIEFNRAIKLSEKGEQLIKSI